MRLFQGLAGRQQAQPAAQARGRDLHEPEPAGLRRYIPADLMRGLGDLVDRNDQVRAQRRPPAA
jgi:hypothetical protein